MATTDLRFEVVVVGTPTFSRTMPDGRVAHFWAYDPAPSPAKRRTSAADRTRSARWRAGTRRHRRVARRRRPARDPWAGWTDVGWTSDEGSTYW